MHIRGSVRLEVNVTPSGVPKSTKVLGGHPLLVQAATDALSMWRWTPGPSETTEVIEIKFNPD
jgi:TonB family protein